jgi:hypothetical protein
LNLEKVSGKDIRGTPAIGNLDDDEELEIVFSGYSSNNKIFAINYDGSDVVEFPFDLNEKVLAGVALAKFDDNLKDDIVLVTDDGNIYLIFDNGTIAPGFPFSTDDKIWAAPLVVEIGSEKVILSGSYDFYFYAINSDGSLRFKIQTGDAIQTSPSFLEHNGETYIYFGSNDNKIYAVDDEGNALDGWPIEVNGSIVGSVVFSDLHGDGAPEVVAATSPISVAATTSGAPSPSKSENTTEPTMLPFTSMGHPSRALPSSSTA